MKSLELMRIHPKAAIVVKQWMLEKLLDSLNDDTLPENFKDFVRENGIDDDKISAIIDSSPRILFDMFDGQNIYIGISVSVKKKNSPIYRYSFDGEKVESSEYSSRIEVEIAALEEAFKRLNDKL